MAKASAILYCGHESRYGLAHLPPLLSSDVLDVREVVFAPFERWKIFRTALSGVQVAPGVLDSLNFKRRTRKALRLIRLAKKRCPVRFVLDVNTKDEIANAARYDLIISAAYPQIFSAELVGSSRKTAINFHPSYLPRCRGAHPVYWTIASRESFGGVSCHLMTPQLDAGPIVARRRIDFDKETISYTELYALIERETPKLVRDVEDFFAQGRAAVRQDGDPSYFRNDRTIHHKLFFDRSDVGEISAQIRAGQAFAFDRKGRRVLILPPVEVLDTSRHVTNDIGERIANGTVVDVQGETIDIKVGDRFVRVQYVILSDHRFRRFLERVLRKLVGRQCNTLEIGEILR